MALHISSNVTPKAKQDILDLDAKIKDFKSGVMEEDDFRKLRLARGVYGQRQPGVQMVRIKLPYGRMTTQQLIRIANCADKFATGILHATTRQDIQIHYVKIGETPQLWSDLEDVDITLREACGNTVRNVTGSPNAGIDPYEPFDITPYAHAVYQYFLRNPICQEMGRKVKIAVSSSEKDSAFTFMHDIGLIPIVKNGRRGFKLLVGGGLGAQPFMAKTAYEWIEENKVLPTIESFLRVYDRYGERSKRQKARIKFLINEWGITKFLEHTKQILPSLKHQIFEIDSNLVPEAKPPEDLPNALLVEPNDLKKFEAWRKTNTYEQKQKGYFAVQLRVHLGDINSDTARKLAEIVKVTAADDIRVTVNQGYLLRFVKEDTLPYLFNELDALSLANPGFDSVSDIISCPGTSTCNLGITSSKGVTTALEKMIEDEYEDLVYNQDIKIKISGCMNGCGQHSIANIGFHGSSIKKDGLVIPALQVLIGGGFNKKGEPSIADKITKIPAKSAPDAVRLFLDDYEKNKQSGEFFNDYAVRRGKRYFFELIKHLTQVSNIPKDFYIDWGESDHFNLKVGVGECAGVMIDLVSSIINDAETKLNWANNSLQESELADSVYHTYNAFILGAKGLLAAEEKETNTQYGIINDFDKTFCGFQGFHTQEGKFKEQVLSINQQEPTRKFAEEYLTKAVTFLQAAKNYRENLVKNNGVKLSEYVTPKDS